MDLAHSLTLGFLLLVLLFPAFNASSAASGNGDAATSLWRWAESHGAEAKALTVVTDSRQPGGGRGLQATRPLHKGERVLAIPKELLMTPFTAAQSERGAAAEALIPDELVELPAPWVLALHLLLELAEANSSYWGPFLAVLPTTQTSLCCLPRNLTTAEESLAAAIDSPIWGRPRFLEEAMDARKCMLGGYDYFEKHLFAPHRDRYPDEHFGLHRWAFAYGTVTSRSFEVGVGEETGSALVAGDGRYFGQRFLAFVPLLDLANKHIPDACSDEHDVAHHQDAALAGATKSAATGDGTSSTSSSSPAAAAANRPFLCGSGGINFNETHLSTTAYWFSDSSGAFHVFADQDVAAGQPFEISYGSKTSSDLVEQYGFLLPQNPHDVLAMVPSAVIPIAGARGEGHTHGGGAILTPDPLLRVKQELLRVHGLQVLKRKPNAPRPGQQHQHQPEQAAVGAAPDAWGRLTRSGRVGRRFLAALRIRSLTPSDLSAMGTDPHSLMRLVRALEDNRQWFAPSSSKPFLRPLTVASEQRVRIALARYCEDALKGYGTSLYADIRMLEGSNPVERLLLRLQIQMKRLLHACVLRQFEYLWILYRQWVTLNANSIYANSGEKLQAWENASSAWGGQLQSWWTTLQCLTDGEEAAVAGGPISVEQCISRRQEDRRDQNNNDETAPSPAAAAAAAAAAATPTTDVGTTFRQPVLPQVRSADGLYQLYADKRATG